MDPVSVHPHYWCGGHAASLQDQPEKLLYNYGEPKEGEDRGSMSLLSEVMRFNNLHYEYILEDESGPPHKKQFTVKLIIGQKEEYIGSGPSIKKAQQDAAQIAYQKTTYLKPVLKKIFKEKQDTYKLLVNVCKCLNLSVETILPDEVLPHTAPFNESTYMSEQHAPLYYIPRPNQQLHIKPSLKELLVHVVLGGSNIFSSSGSSVKEAKIKASFKALNFLTFNLIERNKYFEKMGNNENNVEPVITKNVISLIHEYAVKMKMAVEFNLLSESGPPHSRSFVFECRVISDQHSFTTEGEGNSKKTAKAMACQKMLEALKSYMNNPVFVATYYLSNFKRNICNQNKDIRKKILVKDRKMDPEYGHHINPVSRLVQIAQLKKETDPVFNVVEEKNTSRRKEFCVEVIWTDLRCEGKGPNKKLAKRAAAEALLDKIGYYKPMKQPGKSLLKKTADAYQNTIDHFDFNALTEKASKIQIVEEEQEDKFNEEKPKKSVSFNATIYGCAPPDNEAYPKVELGTLKDEGPKTYRKKGKGRSRMLNFEDRRFLQEKAKQFVNTLPEERFESALNFLSNLSHQFRFKYSINEFPAYPDTQNKDPLFFVLINLNLEDTVLCKGYGITNESAKEAAAENILTALSDFSSINNKDPTIHL
uniref:DRBM domain-containing protein n=1 Tax=Rhabditophanes sp. KR3021 TaxID=114890 RepID=A0AC35TG30_9BILA